MGLRRSRATTAEETARAALKVRRGEAASASSEENNARGRAEEGAPGTGRLLTTRGILSNPPRLLHLTTTLSNSRCLQCHFYLHQGVSLRLNLHSLHIKPYEPGAQFATLSRPVPVTLCRDRGSHGVSPVQRDSNRVCQGRLGEKGTEPASAQGARAGDTG
ncbi:hypothetical protein NDU88_004658 [Pleurodeles waltl]|uniref:Uncharacterized protein n=1 Tax=Pleurodeles waltl TaxID=8319 RepID=A0AAV7WAD7_PLEWA|nr:hypothetical protein NDU88_004658 [Pleurodeles waltl]